MSEEVVQRRDDEAGARPHPALGAISRLVAGWRLPRLMEDEPATYQRVLERLAQGDRP